MVETFNGDIAPIVYNINKKICSDYFLKKVNKLSLNLQVKYMCTTNTDFLQLILKNSRLNI